MFVGAQEVYEKPPAHIYDRAVEQFGVDFDDGVIFTYKDKIYTSTPLPDHLWAHEMTHVSQQKEMGADAWWDKYFADAEFRLSQEVEAYHNQYEYYSTHNTGRNERFNFLREIAVHLCQIYGLEIGFPAAMQMIKTGKIKS